MATVKTFCNHNPAVAIKAMIDGLATYKSIENFRLDFMTFGSWRSDVCYGCAATLTLIKLLNLDCAPYQFGKSLLRAGMIQTSLSDLLDFEKAIDMFRCGIFSEIEKYFDLPASRIFCFPWYCHGGNLQSELPKMIHFWEDFTGQEYKLLTSKGISTQNFTTSGSKESLDKRWAAAIAVNDY